MNQYRTITAGSQDSWPTVPSTEDIPDLHKSTGALPSGRKEMVGSPVVALQDLFERSFILTDDQMVRLRESETLTLANVEFAFKRDHRGRNNNKKEVFVFRVFPKELVDEIRKISWKEGENRKVRWDDLEDLVPFNGFMVTWEDSNSYRPDYYGSIENGQMTNAMVKLKEVRGEERLVVCDFTPLVSIRQLRENSFILDDTAMGELRDGKALQIDGIELAAKADKRTKDKKKEFIFAFRVIPETVIDSLGRTRTVQDESWVRWGEYVGSALFNGFMVTWEDSSLDFSDHYRSIQVGQKTDITVQLREIGGTERLVVRDFEPAEEVGESADSEKESSNRPQSSRGYMSHSPGSAPQESPQGRFRKIDGQWIHRDGM